MNKIPSCPKCGEKMMEESNDDEYFWYCPDCDVSLSKIFYHANNKRNEGAKF
jgi:ribosomal protein L37AE/L43A